MCWAALSATVWTKRSRVRSGAMRAHVERTITLDQVAAAQRDMETGHGRGKIVVRMS